MTLGDVVARSERSAAGVAPLPFVAKLLPGVDALLALTTDEKLDAFDQGARHLLSARGKPTRDALIAELIAAGYPEGSARKEVDALPMLLARHALASIVANPDAIPRGADLLDGAPVALSPGISVTGFPVGPVIVIGSGNAFLPAVVATVQALLAGCPVALRGSRLNQRVLEHLFDALRSGGGPTLRSVLDHVHLFFVDHRVPAEAEQLHELLRTGPFGAGVFWGGREMLDTLLPTFALNPRHPVPIPMEPLTGVALLTERWVRRSHASEDDVADDLAEAMTLFGQQMCSSPTEGLWVGDPTSLHGFGDRLAGALARSGDARRRTIDAREALLLDRVRERCEDAGSTVLMPRDRSASWTVVLSEGSSVFESEDALALPIHDRTAFLELIALPDLTAAAERVATLASAPCHRDIKQVQTILRFAHLPDAQQVVAQLRARGGVFRVVPPEHVAFRHPLEPYDGQHLLSLFVRRTIVL